MPYRFFTSSKKTWTAMFEAVKAAKESVYIEMYMFEADIKNYNFSPLLQEKARRGLRIRIITDSLGSRNVGKNKIKEFTDSGIELYFISHFFHRTHRKILIVDESIAFIGGVNFSEGAKNWEDLAMEIRGRLVKHVVRSFAKAYVLCGGKDPLVVSKNQRLAKDVRAWLVEHFPYSRKFSLKKIYQKHIKDARENISIITPYLVPNRWLMTALDQAIIRGVKVEILMPEKTDIYFSNRVNLFYILKLSEVGAKFYLTKKMNHAKAMIIDSREAIVGSHNLDFLSFDFNDEIAVILKEKEAVSRVCEIAEKWKSESSAFVREDYKSDWLDYILFPVLRIFSFIY